jgi:hypothetical protein
MRFFLHDILGGDSLKLSFHYNIMQHFIRSKKHLIYFFKLQIGIYWKYYSINIHQKDLCGSYYPICTWGFKMIETAHVQQHFVS